MEAFEMVLLLFGIVLASAVLDQIFTRISLPLVQIAIGAVLAFIVGGPLQMTLDPELFLVLFIAPLLFDESRRVDKKSLMGNLSDILSLAIGLVLVSMLAVGFVLHWLEPSIPLAAAFALGAALGPTDAVAVSSLSGSVRLSKRQSALLSGEALINDASGVVSFEFAAAAAVTGAFSLFDAGQAFAVTFLGGIALGILLAVVAMAALKIVRAIGLESTVFHVTSEICTPFAIYLAAESLAVSGILAVVAAGLIVTLFPQRKTAAVARTNIVSGSVWEVLTFILNGIVFVLLGMELPQATLPSWQGSSNLPELIGLVLAVTAVIVAIRFIWIFVMEAARVRRRERRRGTLRAGMRTESCIDAGRTSSSLAKDALVTTLAGPKGAVALSIAFTIPLYVSSGEAFPWRNELLFLVSGVILCTLLLANFILPLLAPAQEDEGEQAVDVEVRIDILDRVIADLREKADPQRALATAIVSGQLEERRAQLAADITSREAAASLRAEVFARQMASLSELQQKGLVDEASAGRCRTMLERSRLIVERHVRRGGGLRLGTVMARLKMALSRSLLPQRRERSAQRGDGTAVYRTLLLLEGHAVDYLKTVAHESSGPRAEVAERLAGDHEKALALMRQAAQEFDAKDFAEGAAKRRQGTARAIGYDAEHLQRQVDELEAEALRLDLGYIQDRYEEGCLTRDQAASMREAVYVLQMDLVDTSD